MPVTLHFSVTADSVHEALAQLGIVGTLGANTGGDLTQPAHTTTALTPLTVFTQGAAFTQADAAAALGDMVKQETGSKRKAGRPSKADQALRQVELAQAEQSQGAAVEVVAGEGLDTLLGTDPDPVAEVSTQAAPVDETVVEPSGTDESLDALFGLGGDDMASLLGEAVEETPKETYASWDHQKLYDEVRRRCTDRDKPLGTDWLRKVIQSAKKQSLAAMTDDELRSALIKNDAGLDP